LFLHAGKPVVHEIHEKHETAVLKIDAPNMFELFVTFVLFVDI
jgi:hypothetical protein